MISLRGRSEKRVKYEDPSSRIFFTVDPNATNLDADKNVCFLLNLINNYLCVIEQDLILN